MEHLHYDINILCEHTTRKINTMIFIFYVNTEYIENLHYGINILREQRRKSSLLY